MSKAIFTTKVNPTYRDLPEVMYHFPKTYLRYVNAAVGDWIIYYEPRREDSMPGGRAGRQAYFATALLTHLAQDPVNANHFYAYVTNYIEFSSAVPFKRHGKYFENNLMKPDGSTNKGAFGRAVRLITDDEYQAIISAGMASIKDDIVDELRDEPEFCFDVERPLIKQILERPFREIAFSISVKAEYESTCAMTGISVRDERNNSEVEAAHIKPVKSNGPDSIRNGIALSRTMHWMFDRGLVSISDSFEILVKKIVPERVVELFNIDGKIRLPSRKISIPHPEFLKFHRSEVYKINEL